ncbi:bifunctional glutamate N-acetyltransferase/amino-acid acetyltransferase ArgJ [Granulicella tundricola]|uniref:Arginine biosynthesis bifunctional protein ArgJ n=1 Tax=Granulicella tundricola (strain ATCC BAA-1859 / DSM 23138 / MP5ACTX9) TaxID=1198114 RepID=E8WVG2_GRATM|nr:bifunctional glutamate N-acetyltransferase/amino-acid acetyltransferase ArgJ [Granulicella tundricola]ADW68410.1 arginine biosynthesis bifunctional protein ArgJ [Granulicella tundricola MP5ACTX9]
MAISDKVQTGALPLGFVWGAVKAGIKASGNLDVAVAVAPKGANAAAMFTRNQVVAAPVIVGRRHLEATGGRVSALLVNAGNANCATGEAGIKACIETCRAAGETFQCIFDEVFPSSTGIIGVPLPAEKILAALPKVVTELGATPAHAEAFATAIMTTDTKMKVARAVVDVDGAEVRIFGVAKGAGMIHPQLVAADAPKHATMLVYLFTDLVAEAAELSALLGPSVERSFNSISIDGDTSTNDTVLLLASGGSGIKLDERVGEAFGNALKLVCGSLAHQIVDDGEGVGHVVTLEIRGAETEADAKTVAKSIAHSPLCKTAWSSADPNWGRLLAAAGYSGVKFDPANVNVWIGTQAVFENGGRAALFDKDAAHQIMLAREYTITLDLGMGSAGCTFLTCDLTEEYVRINADYST